MYATAHHVHKLVKSLQNNVNIVKTVTDMVQLAHYTATMYHIKYTIILQHGYNIL